MDEKKSAEQNIIFLAGRHFSRRQFLTGVAATGLVAVTGGLLEACSPTPPAPQAGAGASPIPTSTKATKTIVIAIPESISNPDPPILGSVGYGDTKVIVDNINEGIVRFKPGTLDVEPALAESWDVSGDGLVYTFHLRKNVKFHDGTPLNAEAVKLNYDRQIDDKNPYHFPGITYTEIVFSDIDKIEAVGEYDLRITQKRPSVLLLGNLAMYVEGIVSPAALQKYGKDYAQHPTGTGPFKFDHWTKDVEFVMVASDDYWGGRPQIDRVVWRTIKDNTVRLQELKSGSIDLATEIDFKDINSVNSTSNLQTISGEFLNTQYLAISQLQPPFNNLKVRQAVEYAINKQNIANAIFYGNYTIGAGPVHPSLLGYDQSLQSMYTYDPNKAKQLLQEAGVTDLSFEILSRNESFWPQEATLVQADLAAIGAKVNIRQMDSAAFYAEINASKSQAFINDWVYDTGDPDNITLSMFSSPRALSRYGYNNPQVDALNKAAQVERDPQKRAQMYKDVQRLILEDAGMVILGYAKRVMGAKKGINNLKISPIGSLPLGGVTMS